MQPQRLQACRWGITQDMLVNFDSALRIVIPIYIEASIATPVVLSQWRDPYAAP